MKEKINVLCATDKAFIPYCGIMLTSLFRSNPTVMFEVYVLVDDANDPIYNKYYALAKKHKGNMHIIEIPQQVLKEDYIRSDGYLHSTATYYRLMAEKLLPNHVEKVLYLDGDIIVNGDIIPLWKTNLTNKALGIVPDCLCFKDSKYLNLQYPKSKGYGNAGVLLLNLKYMREQGFSDRCFHYLNEHSHELECYDQDVINKIFVDDKIFLPLTYNFQFYYICRSHYPYYDISMQNEIIKAFQNPVIVHYCGSQKPWQLRFRGLPFSNLWLKYQLKSYWKFIFDFRPYNKILKHGIKRLLWAFGLKRNQMGIMPQFLI